MTQRFRNANYNALGFGAVVVAVIMLMSYGADRLSAQQTPASVRAHGGISGVVRDTNGAPIQGALVVVLGGAKGSVTDSTGHFMLSAISSDSVIISVRRMGFRQKVQAVHAGPSPVTIVLDALPPHLETVVVNSARAGVFGRVLDTNDDPIPGATVAGSGERRIATTDSAGRFGLPRLTPGGHLLDIRRLGFLPARLSLRIGQDAGREVTIRLRPLPSELSIVQITALSGLGPPSVQEQEFAKRQAWHSYNAALVSEDELDQYGNAPLGSVIQSVPSIVEKSLRVPENVCVFVNGIARPSASLSDFRSSQIEAVEVIGHNGDYTGTLAMRWPPGAVCGDPTTKHDTRTRARAGENYATYINILLRGR